MSDASAGVPNRGLITASIMLATVMNTLDTTIANVALPHMAGSVSASADQITWVLTSYIVAAAIMTPMSGWLANRFGRKSVFMVSIIGFTIASALCGAAGSLTQMVGFRLLQGAFGAALVPLSQAVLMDINPPEEQGPAMAIWGMGSLLGPIVGPALGGWLTDDLSWRWVFYINVPFGILAALGVFSFVHDGPKTGKTPFDFAGFVLLSAAIGSFQLFLDRGSDKAWLDSPEIWIEMTVAIVALVLFVFHTLTAGRPFLPIALIKDRNFASATLFGFFVGVLMYATLALLPPMLENLMGYPVVTTGMVTAPRGLGSLVSMFLVGRMINRFDARLLVGIGLLLSSVALLGMSGFSLGMDQSLVVTMGVVQGVGLGLVFVPLTTLGFATLDSRYRAEGAGVFTLVRSLGSSAGISIMQALLTHNTQVVQSRLTEGLRADNPLIRTAAFPSSFSLTAPRGVAALEAEVGRQASMVAYIDNFKLMFLMGVFVLPLLLLMRPPKRGAAEASHVAFE